MAPIKPERDIRATELRPTRWVEHYGVIQQIVRVKETHDTVWVETNRKKWIPLHPKTWVGIWETNPNNRYSPDPNAPFNP